MDERPKITIPSRVARDAIDRQAEIAALEAQPFVRTYEVRRGQHHVTLYNVTDAQGLAALQHYHPHDGWTLEKVRAGRGGMTPPHAGATLAFVVVTDAATGTGPGFCRALTKLLGVKVRLDTETRLA